MREGWKYISFEEGLEKVAKTSKIASSDYKEKGKYPIVSQEETLISGFWDNYDDVYKIQHPVVIFGDHTRIIKFIDFNFVVGADGVKILSPKSNIDPKFFYYYLRWCNIPSLGYSRHYKLLKELQIPVPPLSEQERIVAELDLLTGIIDKQKAQLQELDTLALSIFYDMFGDPVQNEKGWDTKIISEVCLPKKHIQRASKSFKPSDAIRYVDISSIDNINNVMTSTTQYVFSEAPSRAQQVVHKNDILISLVRPNLNNVAMVSIGGSDLVASSGFCVLRVSDIATKDFLFFSVKMKCFVEYLMQRVSGANYPAVREDDIFGYRIIFPPKQMRQSFAQKIQSIESQKASINQSIAETQKLFDYTMDKYFG